MAINIEIDPKGINISDSERKERSKITLELNARSKGGGGHVRHQVYVVTGITGSLPHVAEGLSGQ